MPLSRGRVNYQVQALYVGPTPSTGGHYVFEGAVANSGTTQVVQLYRIQSCNHSFNIPRTNINQFGELAAIDRVIINSPTVSFGFNYIQANMANESGMGFICNGAITALSGILSKTKDDKNYFVKTVLEGVDANGDTTNTSNVSVLGVGNGFVTSYTAQGAVGTFPTVDVGVEALNMVWQTGIMAALPSINPANGARITQWNYGLPNATGSPGGGDLDISALRPGDISLSLLQRSSEDEAVGGPATAAYSTPGVALSDAKIQSYNVSFNLSREAISQLGERFARTREVTYPVDVTCRIDAILGDITTGTLSDIINQDSSYDITIKLAKPENSAQIAASAKTGIINYIIKNAKLNSEAFTHRLGSNETVTLEFASQVGGPNQFHQGIFFSGFGCYS